MKKGTYKHRPIDLTKFQALKLPICCFNKKDYLLAGCGAHILGMLTGVSPYKILGNKGHYSDIMMLKFLRKHGFSVIELNQAKLTNTKQWVYKIEDQHVIMYSSLIRKGEASWFLMNNGMVFHKGEIQPANYLSFINFPILSAYVLFHPSFNE